MGAATIKPMPNPLADSMSGHIPKHISKVCMRRSFVVSDTKEAMEPIKPIPFIR
ncbi:hypothetical protein D3C84_1179370 [compost metagenome]